MVLYAANRFPGDGSTTSYEFNFVGKYIDRSHVKVYQEDDETKERIHIPITDSNFLNDTTLTGLPVTPVGSTLVIYRDTPKAPLVDFVNGSRFTEKNMDLVARQGLFVATEALGYGEGGGGGYSLPLPAPEANKLLGWDGSGEVLVNYDQSSGGGGLPLPAPEANKLLGWNGSGTALVNYNQSGGDMSAYVTKTQLAGTSGASMVGMLNGSTPSTVSAVIASLRADIAANRIIVTNDAAFNSLVLTGALLADHFYVVKDTEKVYFATGPSAYFLVASEGGGGGGGTATGYTKVVMIGDSMIAQQPLFGSSWPTLWAERMATAGAKVDMHNLAIGGWTFNKALTLKPYEQGTKTMLQAAIDLNPDVVFVQLGANDAVLNIEGRSLSQVQNDAAQVFQQLRTALPNATIVYVGEIMYDGVNFPNPGSSLKNKGVGPYMMQKRSSGILAGCYCSEILDDQVSATTRNNVANWVALDSYIAGLSTINTYFRVNQWRATRLGGCGPDGVHLTQAGNLLLAAYALRACVENVTLRARWPVINSEWYNSWSHPDTLFTDALTASGDGWVETNNPASEFVMTALGDFRSMTPSNWYLPSGAQFRVGSVKHPASPSYPTYWSITGGKPRTGVQISIDGGAFTAVDPLGPTTDALGNCVAMANGAALPVGNTVLRWKCGNEVYGPITIETQPHTPSNTNTPHLEVFSTSAQSVPPMTITTAFMGNVGVNLGSGSWNGESYTVPMTGRYQVSFTANFEQASYNTWCQVLIYIGETCRGEGGVSSGFGPYSGWMGSSASVTLNLTAGQSISFRVMWGGQSGTINLIAGSRNRSTSATVSYLGA